MLASFRRVWCDERVSEQGSDAVLRTAPCIKNRPRRRRLCGAVSAESPYAPRAGKPVPERGASAVDFVIPNGRLGRTASPHAQGWEPKSMFVGIDVAKDRLDVHVRPAGESF